MVRRTWPTRARSGPHPYRPTVPRASDDAGQSIVETALTVPIVLILLIAAFDGSRGLLAGTVIQSAVLAGAQYGALSAANATDTSGIATAVRNEVVLPQASSTNPTISSSTATDSDGETRVTVTATFTMTALLPYPGLPSTFVITRSAVLQVRR